MHAILASGGSTSIETLAAFEGRLAGATEAEIEAAIVAACKALEHPILRRAARSRDVRREEPLVFRSPEGTVIEGVADLAFLDEDGSWVVLDFKTDERPEDHLQYAAQLRLYCAAIEAATGTRARPVLLAV